MAAEDSKKKETSDEAAIAKTEIVSPPGSPLRITTYTLTKQGERLLTAGNKKLPKMDC